MCGCMCLNKVMIGRNNLCGIVGVLKKGEVVWFVFDQDYGFKGSFFVLFFVVGNVVIINGIYVLFRLFGVVMLIVIMVRKFDNLGYCLYIIFEMEGYLVDEN